MSNKPKLLHVLPALNAGGTEFGVLNLQSSGFYKNFEVEILALAHGTESTRQSFLNAFGANHVTTLCSKHDVGYQDLPFLLPSFLRAIHRIKPDAVILSLPKSVIMGTIAGLFYPKLTVVCFEHMGRRYGYKLAALLKCLTHRANFIFGDCMQTIETAREIFAASAIALEVPLLEIKNTYSESANTKPECFEMLSLGRFNEQKNYVELLYALHQVKQKNILVHLTLAGQGELEGVLRKTVNELGLTAQVTFAGFVNASLRDDLLRAAHIYVQPSLYEGQCLSVIEAMAAGKTVVATDVGGMKWYGRDEVNMHKINGFTRDGIAQALLSAIQAYPNSAMMRSASQTAQQEYGHDAVQQKWQKAINALLKSIQECSQE